MSVTIHKNDSDKAIREAIQKLRQDKRKRDIDLDQYFGKVSFNIEGLEYQRDVRNEWK